MSSVDDGNDFGFRVEFDVDDFDEPLKDRFKVSLPHKCDRWRVDNDNQYLEGSTKEEAVEELEEFIRQAKEALEALKLGEEFRND